MSYHEGSNWQAKKEDEKKPLYSSDLEAEERKVMAEDGIIRNPLIDQLLQQLTDAKEEIKLLKSQPTPSASVEEIEKANNYVCGFYFDKQVRQVVLIWKQKPAWQAGNLNGVGGKIEKGETPSQAMIREFREETGLLVSNWKPLIELSGDDWIVHFFYAQDSENQFEYAETMEAEEVAKIDIDTLDDFNHIKNLRWLIPFAVYRITDPRDNPSILAGSKQRVSVTREQAEQEAKGRYRETYAGCISHNAFLACYDWMTKEKTKEEKK